jgi:glutathione S-transferase
MRTLFSYNVSPYAAKVRAILRYKGLAFDERIVHPLRRQELKRLSGQLLVPVLVDGTEVVADSTRIARFLDERYPGRPILPRDPALRARALLFEEWADEGLPRAVQPVRWLIPANFERTFARMRSAYPAGARDDLEFAAVRRFMAWDMNRKYGGRFGRPRPSKILNRLAEVVDLLDGALAETGWLAGPEPSVADFAAWGFLNFLDGLDGWETVKVRRRVARLVKALGAPGDEAPAAYDAEDAALIEASHHRRATQAEKRRLPLVDGKG